MPSIYDLKPRFQAALRPLLAWLASHGATPNIITVIAIVGSLVAGAGVSRAAGHSALLLILPVWLLLRMALNALDGMMARERHMASSLGMVLNELGDVVSDLALYLPLAWVFAPARWPVVAFSIGAVLTEFSGLLGVALGSTRRYEGPMGKSDRALWVSLLGLVTFFLPQALAFWPWILGLGAALTLVTCWNRVRGALAGMAAARTAPPSSRSER